MQKKELPVPPDMLAMQIYIELISRNTQVSEGAVKLSASATNLAALALKLADVFAQVREQVEAAKAPITTYKLEGSDIADWTTK
jgi:hypothetical protein